ncbi:CLUMA_CG017691, isoform A [Clunio marinus]|uniref:CLUMA_CG017691, isoform A n=1 Tax=Clunio marinus TaxID=568069 RepID=A0A1J1IWT9_9DIPT|nr:CLUMA_CG017691, isoform A [Clunio marinus]
MQNEDSETDEWLLKAASCHAIPPFLTFSKSQKPKQTLTPAHDIYSLCFFISNRFSVGAASTSTISQQIKALDNDSLVSDNELLLKYNRGGQKSYNEESTHRRDEQR